MAQRPAVSPKSPERKSARARALTAVRVAAPITACRACVAPSAARREPFAAAAGPASTGGRSGADPRRRHPVHDRQLVGRVRLPSEPSSRTFPASSRCWRRCPTAGQTCTSPSSRRTWARAAENQRLRRRRRRRQVPVRSPRAPCTDTTLAPGATFIVDDGGSNELFRHPRATYFPASPTWASAAAASRARSPRLRARSAPTASPPPENQGFLRPDAYLMIVVLTDEDDCSATLGASSPLFDVDPQQPRRAPRPRPELPLQRVRACLRPGNAEPTCSERARDGHGQLHGLPVERRQRLPEISRLFRGSDPAPQAPSRRTNLGLVDRRRSARRSRTAPSPIRSMVTGARDGHRTLAVLSRPSCGASAAGACSAIRPSAWPSSPGTSATNGLLYSVCDADYGPVMSILAERLADQMAR